MDHACPMLVVKGKVPAFVEPVGVAVHGAEKLLGPGYKHTMAVQRTNLLVPLWHILVLRRLTRRSEFQVEVAVFAVRGVS